MKNSIVFFIVLTINLLYFFIELIYGFILNSITLKTDAFHMLSDVISILISFYCENLSTKKRNNNTTYGWVRSKIIGGFTNTIFLLSMTFHFFIESLEVIILSEKNDKLENNVDQLLIVASIGLAINFISMILFHKEHDNSLNIRALFLHFIADTLSSILVIISGLFIKYVDNSNVKLYIDPICSIIIAMIIIVPSVKIYKQGFQILLQYSPTEINIEELRKRILNIDFVKDIHELHVWILDEYKYIGTLHFTIEPNMLYVPGSIKKIMHNFGIHSTTIQPEEYNEHNVCNEIICDDNCNSKKCCEQV